MTLFNTNPLSSILCSGVHVQRDPPSKFFIPFFHTYFLDEDFLTNNS